MDELISDVLQWTPTHELTSDGRLAKTYTHQFCRCRQDDLPRAMADRGGWCERVKGIRAVGIAWYYGKKKLKTVSRSVWTIEYADSMFTEDFVSSDSPGYDIKEFDDEAPLLKRWGIWNTLLLPLLPGPLWFRVVVSVRVLSMNQIGTFYHSLYLKPFDCAHRNDCWIELSVLDSNI